MILNPSPEYTEIASKPVAVLTMDGRYRVRIGVYEAFGNTEAFARHCLACYLEEMRYACP